MGRFLPIAVAAAVILFVPRVVTGQDSHFWSHQYGARSTLLGGAVIAGVDDASATFYNPGALAIIEQGDLFEGTRVFDFTSVSFHAEQDEAVSLGSDDFGRAPSFLGGVVPTGWKRHTLSYAMFKRQAFDIRANHAVADNRDVIRRNPGTEPVFASVKIDKKLSEQWVGLGWSYAVSPQIGFGVTTFVARRSQRGLSEAAAEAVIGDGTVLSSTYSDFYKYSHYRLLWKAGLSISSERASVGLTFTSPSFSIKGSGEREIIDAQSGLDIDQDGAPDYSFAADFQDNVSTNYKAPVSVGVGYSLRLDGRTIHLSAEWYRNLPQYTVIRVDEAIGQTSGLPIDNGLFDATDAVINGAIGVEQSFGRSLTGFASLSTDFSTTVESSESELSVTRWDLYHVASGARMVVRKASLTLGIGYVFGGEESPEDKSLVDIDESNSLFGRSILTERTYRRLQFIVGLSVKT